MRDIEKMIEEIKHGLTKSQVTTIFNDCERTFSHCLIENINGEYNNVLEKVKTKAKNSTGFERITYSKIYEFLYKSQDTITDEFSAGMRKIIKEKLSKGFKEEINASNLVLLDDAEVEANINAKNFEQRIIPNFSEGLNDLSIRLNFLLSDVDNEKQASEESNKLNPLGPDVVTQSLALSLHKVIRDNQMHKQAMYFFEDPVASEIREVYKALNGYLIEKKIIPDIKAYLKYQAKKASELKDFDLNFEPDKITNNNLLDNIVNDITGLKNRKPAPKEQEKPISSEQLLDNIVSELANFKAKAHLVEPQEGKQDKQKTPPKNIFDNFNFDLRTTEPGEQARQPYVNNPWMDNSFSNMLPELNAAANGGTMAGAPMSDNLKGILNSFANIVKTLPKLNAGFPQLTDQQVKYQLLNSDALSHLNSSKSIYQEQVQLTKYNLKYIIDNNITPRYRNVIKSLDQKQLQPNTVDQIIIELLGLVFEKIFLQNDLTEHHKYLISKLQLPILKTSLANKDFFVNSENPVRKFLDKLATADSIFNQRYALRFEIIIDEILQKELIDQHVFDESLGRIDKLIEDIKKTENNIIEIASEAALNIERMQKDYDQVINKLDKTIQTARFPPVKAFIEKVWAPSFVKKWEPWANSTHKNTQDFISGLPPAAGAEFNSSVAWFDILIWSTNINEATSENIKKLKQFIPAIAQGLRRISQDLKIDQEDENQLSNMLAEKHMVLLKNNPPQEYKLMMVKGEGVAKIYSEKQNKTQVILNKEFKKEIEDVNSNFYQDFEVGRWYKFERDGSLFDIKLLWISPAGTVYIFNNQDKQITLQMTKSQVWQKYKSKGLKVIEGPNFNAQELIDESLAQINKRIETAEKHAQSMLKQKVTQH